MRDNFFLLPIALIIILKGSICLAQEKISVKKLESEASAYFSQKLYDKARKIYFKLDSITPNNPLYNFQIGMCLYNTIYINKSLFYFQKAKDLNYPSHFIDFYLARSSHINHKFDDAISYYTKCQASTEFTKEKEAIFTKEEIAKYIAQCNTGKKLVKDSIKVVVSNLGLIINSKYSDNSPVISADETELIFTSRRQGSTGRLLDAEEKFYEDIYYSSRKNKAEPWSEPVKMENGINSNYHDASIGLSPDGQELYIYRDGEGHNGDILVSYLKGNTWTLPVKLNEAINSTSWESSACVSPDKKTLFFSSDRPGGFGGSDIYMAERDDLNNWIKVKNLGPNINTAEDEDAPYMHPDGRTLFFSSRGHENMGGYDIFMATIDKNSNLFNKPENIGYPISTADDDIFFNCATDGKTGYFSSFRNDSYGDKDIYTYKGEIFKSGVYVLNGNVYDSEQNNRPMDALVRIVDLETQKEIGTYRTNPETGKFIALFEYGKNYSIDIEAQGKLFFSENINIPDETKLKEISHNFNSKDIYLKNILIGNKLILRNVFYDYNKTEIKKESTYELDKVVKMLKEHPKLIIEVGGHTDSVGSKQFNQKLSEKRAEAVLEYLETKGITDDRIIAVGYGESQPYIDNDTENNRKLNRRTELEIVEVNKDNFLNTELLNPTVNTDVVVENEVKIEPQEKTSYSEGEQLTQKVHFLVNNYDHITPYSEKKLHAVMEILQNNATMRIKIIGYAHGSSDTEAKNLAENRSKRLVEYFVSKGFEQNRFETGTAIDVSTEKTGNLQFRKAEFYVINK